MEPNNSEPVIAPIAPITPVTPIAPISVPPIDVPSSFESVASSQTLEGVGALLRSSWDFFKAYWNILMPLAVVPSIIMVAGSLLAMTGESMLLVSLLVLLVGVVFSIAMAPTIIDAIQKIDSGNAGSVKLWPQYKIGFTFFWVVVGLGILQALIIMGSSVFVFVPSIIIGNFLCVFLFARVLDGHRGFAAFTESFSLVRGRWWGVFGRILSFALVYLILMAILILIDLAVAAVFGQTSTTTSIISLALNLVLTVVMGPLALIFNYKLYLSLKASRAAMVSTIAFKRWLIAFLVVGIFVAILLPFIGVVAVAGLGQTQVNNEAMRARLDTLRGQMNQSSASSTSTLQATSSPQ